MKLHQSGTEKINLITRYQDSGFVINNETYVNSIIVSPLQIIDDWRPKSFGDLQVIDIEQLITSDPEIIIIGTGSMLQFPDSDLLEPIRKNKCGYEIMDTKAACRTFNILASDGRKVVAGLLSDRLTD